MKLDIEKLTTAIMLEAKKHMIPDPSKQCAGFAAICNTCGSSSISFCPCSGIKNILGKPPADCVVDDKEGENILKQIEKTANNALYFDDGSDYESTLWEILMLINPKYKEYDNELKFIE